jgi:hypothetical protein
MDLCLDLCCRVLGWLRLSHVENGGLARLNSMQ